MKIRGIKRRVVARMLYCHVVTFSWAWGADLDKQMRAIINNRARLSNVIRAYIKAAV